MKSRQAPPASLQDPIPTPSCGSTCAPAQIPEPWQDWDQPYNPRAVEARWYAFWQEHGVMDVSDDPCDPRAVYVIPMPPPNVTGSLHMGHALQCTLQDILVRFFRMRGFNTLWQPGMDHAGIATQMVVERRLAQQGLSRHTLGREAFVEQVWAWKQQHGGRIAQQQKVLGASAAWQRSKFTLDAEMSTAVRYAFVRLFEDGLMYRDTRLINWCPECQTALSDLEVETQEGVQGELFSFAYPLEDGSGEVVVATTRPETLFGDTAVAVHPDDPRYQAIHGKKLKHPLLDRRLPVVTDRLGVDPGFGTGAVKITPAHDFHDFALGKRHHLPHISILNPDGTLNAQAGSFAGIDRLKARKAIKAALEQGGWARGCQPHVLNLPRCQRSGGIVEPRISTQWFLKMKAMAHEALKAVEQGRTQIIPMEWRKTYAHFLTEIQDWCVSRQLWWGHPIPAWYGPGGEIRVAMERPADCGSQWHADEDVLDTWFSSALWPFSTLGWPQATDALQKFYPASDLETGYDILFFWVARMMMLGLYFMKEVPFRRVLLSGLVVDETGEKMSKVKGNVIDPWDLIYGADLNDMVKRLAPGVGEDEARKRLRKAYPSIQHMGQGFAACGADAVRWTLASYAPSNQRLALSPKRMQTSRFFMNKLWNAARLTLSLVGSHAFPEHGWKPVNLYSRWILSGLARTLETVSLSIENFRMDEAVQALYSFLWNGYCDWFLEIAKVVLREPQMFHAVVAFPSEIPCTLLKSFEAALRLLHPLTPFITEELWQRLPKPADRPASIALAAYPSCAEVDRDKTAEGQMGLLKDIISALRALRSEHGIKPQLEVTLGLMACMGSEITPASSLEIDGVKAHAPLILRLVKAHTLHIFTSQETWPADMATHVVTSPSGVMQVGVGLRGVVDPDTERARITRELKKIDNELAALEKKLSLPDFATKAPAAFVQETYRHQKTLHHTRTRLQEALLRVDILRHPV